MCTPSEVKTFVDILPTLSSVGYLRANVQLMKVEDHRSLLRVRGLRSITLEFATWELIRALPTWASDTLGSTLKTLTFYVGDLCLQSMWNRTDKPSELLWTDGGDDSTYHRIPP